MTLTHLSTSTPKITPPIFRGSATLSTSAAAAARSPESIIPAVRTRESIARTVMELDPSTTNPTLGLPIIESLIGRGEFRQAQLTLVKFCENNQDNIELIFQNARLLYLEQRTIPAKVLLNEVLEKNSHHVPAWALLIQILVEEDTLDNATSFIENYSKISKDEWFIKLLIAYTHVLCGKIKPRSELIHSDAVLAYPFLIGHISLCWEQKEITARWNELFIQHLNAKPLLPIEICLDPLAKGIEFGKGSDILSWIEKRLFENPGHVDLLFLKALLLIKTVQFSELDSVLDELTAQGKNDLLDRPFFYGSDMMRDWMIRFFKNEMKAVPFVFLSKLAQIFTDYKEPRLACLIYEAKQKAFPDDYTLCCFQGLNVAECRLSDYSGVEGIFQRALSLAPQAASKAYVHLLYAKALYKIEKYEEALEQLKLSIQGETCEILKIKCYRKLGNYELALQTIQVVIGANLRNPDLWVLKGKIHSDSDQPKLAIEAYAEARKLNPFCLKIILSLSVERTYIKEAMHLGMAIEGLNLYLASNPYDVAIIQQKATALSSLNQHQEALATIERAIYLSPSKPKLQRAKALIASNASNHNKVIEAVEMFSLVKPLDDETQLVVIYAKSIKATKRFKEGIRTLENVKLEILSLEITRLTYLMEFFQALYDKDDSYFKNLKAVIDELRTLDPTDKEILTRKYDLLYRRYCLRRERYDEFLATLDEVIHKDPENDVALNHRIEAKLTHKDIHGALQDLQLYKRLFPTSEDTTSALIHLFKSEFNLDSDFNSTYSDFLSRFLDLYPLNENLLLARIELRLSVNNFDAALRDLNSYLFLHPYDSRCQKLRVWTLNLANTRKLYFAKVYAQIIRDFDMEDTTSHNYQRIKAERSLLVPAWKFLRKNIHHPDRELFLSQPNVFKLFHYFKILKGEKRVFKTLPLPIEILESLKSSLPAYEKKHNLSPLPQDSVRDETSLSQECDLLVNFVKNEHIEEALATLFIIVKTNLDNSGIITPEITERAKNPLSLNLADLYSYYTHLTQSAAHASNS